MTKAKQSKGDMIVLVVCCSWRILRCFCCVTRVFCFCFFFLWCENDFHSFLFVFLCLSVFFELWSELFAVCILFCIFLFLFILLLLQYASNCNTVMSIADLWLQISAYFFSYFSLSIDIFLVNLSPLVQLFTVIAHCYNNNN